MIASVKSAESQPTSNTAFLAMLQTIRSRAAFAFRELDPEAREEAMQQVVVSTFISFGRLVEQDRAHLASPSALARFAIAQVRTGRYINMRLNSQDVLSRYAQQRRGFRVQRLLVSDETWREQLVEDRRATPAEVALTRIDFEEWLATLSPRQQLVVNALAAARTVTELAAQLHLSVGRVSQIRRKLAELWNDFHSETSQDGRAAALS